MDEGLIRRSIIATGWFGGIVLIALKAHGFGWDVVLGAAVGACIMCLALAALTWTVGLATDPERPRPQLVAGALLLKLPVLATVVFLVTRFTIASEAALAAGVAIPILVILCKLAGRAVGGSKDAGRSSTRNEE